MTNDETNAYALPSGVAKALARVDLLKEGTPVTGNLWRDMSASLARIDAVGISLVVQHLSTRPVLWTNADGTTDTLTGVTAFARALGFTSHGTVSHWVKVTGWLQDSGTPVNATTHAYGVTAYNGGKDHRAKIAATLSVLKGMETDAARVARWRELAAGARAARSVSKSDQVANVPESPEPTRAAQVNDGTGTVETFAAWFADLAALQARLYVDGDPLAVRFALTSEQAREVQDVLEAIAEATVGEVTLSGI